VTAQPPSPGDPGSPPSSDRRARQRERRRAELYDVAIELFVEKTYEGTTMEDIADRADVARATVFNHFPRKAAFLQEWASQRREKALRAAHAGGPESAREILVRFFTEIGKLSDASRPESVEVILGSVRLAETWQRSPLAVEFAGIVARAQQRGEIDAVVSPDRVGLILSSSYYVTLTAWASAEPAPFDLAEEMVGTVDLILNGVLPRTAPVR
jgi:AcrR family transcriptional regulator